MMGWMLAAHYYFRPTDHSKTLVTRPWASAGSAKKKNQARPHDQDACFWKWFVIMNQLLHPLLAFLACPSLREPGCR
jgi:hypothetical protein